jgi:predicted aconitase with swiveling domain/8-oxo-dGTP pyrophosphatase MutT (NUDIX family)
VILRGRPIAGGKGEGELVLLEEDFSFLGGVDTTSGELTVRKANIAAKVFAFPRGRGSTVGSYTIYDMKVHGTLPSAIVNSKAETIVTTGAVISSIPLVDGIDLSLLRDGDRIVVDGDDGMVELPDVELRRVVTAILCRGDKVLLLKRSDAVGSFNGYWAGVSGGIEEGEGALEAARRETAEEVGMSGLKLMGSIDPLMVREEGIAWEVNAFLFEADREPTLDWEHTEYRWVDPWEIPSMRTVPGLVQVLRDLSVLEDER